MRRDTATPSQTTNNELQKNEMISFMSQQRTIQAKIGTAVLTVIVRVFPLGFKGSFRLRWCEMMSSLLVEVDLAATTACAKAVFSVAGGLHEARSASLVLVQITFQNSLKLSSDHLTSGQCTKSANYILAKLPDCSTLLSPGFLAEKTRGSNSSL